MSIVDEREWPLLVVRWGTESPTDEQFQAYLDHYAALLGRGQRYAIVFVTEPSAPMTKSKHAKLQATWMKEHYDELQKFCVGSAFVLPSPVMRGVLKAILAMQGMPVEYVVVSDEASGMEWAKSRMAKEGVRAAG